MHLAWLRGVELPHPELWLAVVAGLLSAGMALAVGRMALGRRRPAGPPPAKGAADRKDDPFLQGSACERRISLRRGGTQVCAFVLPANGDDSPLEAWVVDRSTGGIRLSLFDPLPLGTHWKVMVENAPAGTPWVEVEVRDARQDGERYEMGCQFVQPPTWAVLLLFG